MSSANDRLPAAAVMEQLERILASETFRHAGRLRRFLQFGVETTLRGNAGQIKEYAVGLEVFERDPTYDPRIDPVVRVEARRLRAKLQEYYEREGRDDPIHIRFPKGRYIPAFQRRVEGQAPPVRFLVGRRAVLVTTVALAGAAAAYKLGLKGTRRQAASPTRLAVLPMRGYAPPDPEETQRIADSVTEAVLRSLSGDKSLSLVSWPTAAG